MSKNTESASGPEIDPTYLAIGMFFGAISGMPLGLALDSLALGVPIGLGLGITMGLALGASKMKEK